MEVIKWGIFGTGVMANNFAQGLQHSEHAKLFGVASREMQSTRLFAKKHNVVKAYDSYTSLAASNDIDVVYIATPNVLHAQHSILCLENNKAVLCEKPFAINEIEAVKVIELARNKKLFCMEAMWSRFMPIIQYARSAIQSGKIGELKMLSASFSKLKKFDPNNNIYKKELGGGCLLDLGVYPISLALHFLGKPGDVKGFLVHGDSGVDEQVAIIFNYDNGCQALLAAGFNANYDNNIKIYGSKGMITINEPMYRASKLKVNLYSYQDKLLGKIVDKIKEKYLGKTKKIAVKGNGYHYEADEVAKCLTEGRLESDKMSWADTQAVLHIVDQIRSENI